MPVPHCAHALQTHQHCRHARHLRFECGQAEAGGEESGANGREAGDEPILLSKAAPPVRWHGVDFAQPVLARHLLPRRTQAQDIAGLGSHVPKDAHDLYTDSVSDEDEDSSYVKTVPRPSCPQRRSRPI